LQEPQEQWLKNNPSRVLRKLRGRAQELELQQQQQQQSSFSAEDVANKDDKTAFKAEIDKDYNVNEYEDGDDSVDNLEDEVHQEGTGDNSEIVQKEAVMADDAKLAESTQLGFSGSRLPKAIDAARIPIEYNPSEVAVSFFFYYFYFCLPLRCKYYRGATRRNAHSYSCLPPFHFCPFPLCPSSPFLPGFLCS
jgi:hypothetical protein